MRFVSRDCNNKTGNCLNHGSNGVQWDPVNGRFHGLVAAQVEKWPGERAGVAATQEDEALGSVLEKLLIHGQLG